MANNDFDKASQRAIKGWITRRANQAKKKAQKKAEKEIDKQIDKGINQVAKKSKKSIWFNVFVSILAFIVGAVMSVVGYCVINKPKSDVFVSGNLSFHFLELGNEYTGDSTYINAGGVDILIDAGSRKDSAVTIGNYLDQHVPDGKLEFVIATHAHQDHIAAFVDSGTNGGGIFSRYEVGTIIDFPKTEASSAIYNDYIEARDAEIAQGAKHYTALECYKNQNGAQRIYNLTDNIQMEILYNYYYDHSANGEENDYSVCVMFHHGEDRHFLMTGDLEKHGEEHLVEYYNQHHGGLPECVLYKGGHHGSKTSSTTALMNQIKPDIICVCCCAGTTEFGANVGNEFPTQAFIDRVAPYTDKVYVTTLFPDIKEQNPTWTMNGNIVVTSSKNGDPEVNCSNNNRLLKETEWFINNRTMPSAWAS